MKINKEKASLALLLLGMFLVVISMCEILLCLYCSVSTPYITHTALYVLAIGFCLFPASMGLLLD